MDIPVFLLQEKDLNFFVYMDLKHLTLATGYSEVSFPFDFVSRFAPLFAGPFGFAN
jgi:hypothetical protein